jgi:hypothetical protein
MLAGSLLRTWELPEAVNKKAADAAIAAAVAPNSLGATNHGVKESTAMTSSVK